MLNVCEHVCDECCRYQNYSICEAYFFLEDKEVYLPDMSLLFGIGSAQAWRHPNRPHVSHPYPPRSPPPRPPPPYQPRSEAVLSHGKLLMPPRVKCMMRVDDLVPQAPSTRPTKLPTQAPSRVPTALPTPSPTPPPTRVSVSCLCGRTKPHPSYASINSVSFCQRI